MEKKLLLIINPVSGRKKAMAKIGYIIKRLSKAGFNIRPEITEAGSKTARDIVSRYGNLSDLIVCAGGDGTVRDTVSGVITNKLDVPVGVLPMGSTNDFAISAGVPTGDIDNAIDTIVTGNYEKMDMGLCGNDIFIDIARFGNFTSLSYNTSQKLKNALGMPAYYLNALKELCSLRPYHAVIEADGTRLEDNYFFGALSNSYVSIGKKKFLDCDAVRLDDGLHELLLIKMFRSPEEAGRLLKDVLTGNFYKSPYITVKHCRDVSFTFSEPTALCLDGEYGGTHRNIEVKNINRIVNIITDK